MEREPGIYRGEAVGATTETTKRFSMIFDNGDSRWESWHEAQDIEGRSLGEIHQCSVEPPAAGDRVSSPV